MTKAYPHPLPDLFRGDQLVLAGRYTGAGEGDVVIEGLVNGRPRRIVQRVRFPAHSADHEFIAQLWAVRRVGWLLDEIRLRGDHAELRDEVVALARRYAIVTPYTSYLIVEDEARRNVPLAQRSLSALDRDAGARDMLREGYAGLREEKAGVTGTLNARASSSLKDASSADAAVSLNAFEVRSSIASASAARRGFGPGDRPAAPAAAAMKNIESAQDAGRVVGGKTFFQNGAQWIDADSQHRKPAKTVRLQFASEDYFRLLADLPAASPWLALGRSVQFTLGDTFYDIFE